ncbi:MAG TPA: hypothetical protein VFC46_02250 [Humisphaera sp.]|nr:hypothetical protein [Humisphaera sp.]
MSKADKTYTVVLAVLAYISLVSIITLWAITRSPNFRQDGRWAIEMVIATQACFLLCEVVALFVRVMFPASRKWPTIALNIVLLLSFPLGTAIGAYGLWKIDKSIPA